MLLGAAPLKEGTVIIERLKLPGGPDSDQYLKPHDENSKEESKDVGKSCRSDSYRASLKKVQTVEAGAVTQLLTPEKLR